jgi:hypothetical protein
MLGAAEAWLAGPAGMTRSMGPFSPRHLGRAGPADQGPRPSADGDDGAQQGRISGLGRGAGYEGQGPLHLRSRRHLPLPADRPADRRLGEKNRGSASATSTRSRFDEEAALLLSILNDAWSDNWGFVPLTEREIAYAGKKLKPIVLEDMILVAEYDGEPVAFMMALPDINEFIRDLNGELFPFGWANCCGG